MQIRNQPTAQTIVSLDSDFTGIAACSTAGTAQVIGTGVTNEGCFFVKGHPDNTDSVWVFFTGQAKTSGFPLNASEVMFLPVNDLGLVSFDADVTDEKICWIKA